MSGSASHPARLCRLDETRLFAYGEYSHACRLQASLTRSARRVRTQTYRVCRSGRALQKSFRFYEGRVISPRMARYRRWRYAQSANFAKAKADSARMSATGGRSSAAIGKEKALLLGVPLPMAAELGFEPRHTESESAVLPLHNSAILNFIFLTQTYRVCPVVYAPSSF